jgi:hypothetical protein
MKTFCILAGDCRWFQEAYCLHLLFHTGDGVFLRNTIPTYQTARLHNPEGRIMNFILSGVRNFLIPTLLTCQKNRLDKFWTLPVNTPQVHKSATAVFLNICETAARKILFYKTRAPPGPNKFTRK